MTMKIIAHEDALLWLPRDVVDLKVLQAQLTVKNLAVLRLMNHGVFRYSERIGSPVYTEWRDRGDTIGVPRAYDVPLLPGYELERIRWAAPEFTPRLESKITLRPHQIEAHEAIVGKEGIVDMPCGSGKTSLALYTIARESMGPVLVAVHTTELQRQWLDRIQEQMSYVEGGVGVVGGGKCLWEGRGLVVGLMQSLSQKQWSDEFYRYFGRVVIDEAHRAPAETWSEIFRRFPGRRLCLTATWERGDGLHRLLTLHAGPILYSSSEHELEPEIYFVDLGIRVPDPNDVYMWPRVLSALAEDERRNLGIIERIKSAMAAGRHILVLGERVSQLKYLASKFPSEQAGLVIGEVPARVRAAELQKQVVFATTKLAREGLDCPSLDTLFCLAAFKDRGQIKQAVGRILRRHDGKKKPIVVVFEDTLNPTARKISLAMRRTINGIGYRFKQLPRKADTCQDQA